MEINEALVVHTEPLNRLDADFAELRPQAGRERWRRQRTWDEPDLPPDADAAALVALAERASRTACPA